MITEGFFKFDILRLRKFYPERNSDLLTKINFDSLYFLRDSPYRLMGNARNY